MRRSWTNSRSWQQRCGACQSLLTPSRVIQCMLSVSEVLLGVDAQKGEGSAAVDARRKELAAQRAAAGARGAKQFYRVTVRVRRLAAPSVCKAAAAWICNA